MKLSPETVETYMKTGQGTPVLQSFYPKGGGGGEGTQHNSTRTMYMGDDWMHLMMLGANGSEDTDGHFMLLLPNKA